MPTRRATHFALMPLLLLAAGAASADSCDAIKAQIEARIRGTGNGLANFTLSAVDNAASAPGRVVGNCAGGARKILMTGVAPVNAGTGSVATVSAAARPAAAVQAAPGRSTDNLITECNDGTMSVGGSCRK